MRERFLTCSISENEWIVAVQERVRASADFVVIIDELAHLEDASYARIGLDDPVRCQNRDNESDGTRGEPPKPKKEHFAHIVISLNFSIFFSSFFRFDARL